MKTSLFLLLLALSAPSMAVAPNDPEKPVETPGDADTGSSAGYHNTEMNSAGPSTDFGSTIIRSQKEEAIDVQKKKRQEEKKKK